MPSKDGKKIEPKTYFANERTYLQWFNAAAMLGSVSLGLVGLTATSRVIGLIFLPISVCLMLYALFMYHKRLRSIEERRSDGFHDPYGPTCVPSPASCYYTTYSCYLNLRRLLAHPEHAERSHVDHLVWGLGTVSLRSSCTFLFVLVLR